MTAFPPDVRRQIILRDEGCCVVCGVTVANIDDPAPEKTCTGSCHHRSLKGMGGGFVDHSPVNGILLCGSGATGCHARVHRERDWARKHGYVVSHWDSVETVPVDYATEDGTVRYVLDEDRRVRVDHHCTDPDCAIDGIAASLRRESDYWNDERSADWADSLAKGPRP